MNFGDSRYPFGEGWVHASAVIVAVATVFAILILNDLILLLIYVAFTVPLTAAMLVYKFYIYFMRGEVADKHVAKVRMPILGLNLRKSNWKKILVLCLSLSVAALCLPLFFIDISGFLLGGFVVIIVMCGLAAAANIPEIIFYIYFKRRKENLV